MFSSKFSSAKVVFCVIVAAQNERNVAKMCKALCYFAINFCTIKVSFDYL